MIHAPLRRFEPGPLGDWGFDPSLWEEPSRLTLLVLASQLFHDQQERIRFFQKVLREGRSEETTVSLRRADGRPVAAVARGVLRREGTEWALHLELDASAPPATAEPPESPGPARPTPESPTPARPAPERPAPARPAPARPAPARPSAIGRRAEVTSEVVEVPAELRSRVFDRLAIPDTGRTADRMARFLTWVLSRREPLLVAGPEGSGGEVLVELVHEARGDGGTSVQVDAELEPAGAVLAILDVHYGGGAARTDVSGVILRGAHTVDPQVVDRVVAVARVLVRGDEVGPPLYVSAQVGHPLVQRFADEAGGDVFVIPALGERPQDILPGLSRMLRRPRPGGRVFQTVSPGAAQLLQSYHWPGNVDEMREVVEAARLISGGTELRVEDLPVSVVSRGRGEAPDASPRRSVPATMRGRRGRPEKKLTAADIKAALEACDGSRTAAARRLGVSRTTLWRKMAELGEAILDADPGDATRRLEDDGA